MNFQEIKQSGEKLLIELNQEFNIALGFNKQTVKWLDSYITQNRNVFRESEIQSITLSIGYILGEAIIKEYGGEWKYAEDFHQWIVDVGKLQVNPIGKTQKYLENYFDSIESLFDFIGTYKIK